MNRAAAQISFLNHFLIKRGIEAVSCKISAIDAQGRLAGSTTVLVNSPIVYALDLDALFPEIENINQYIVEFFSRNNLVVPYPAVMINHWGEDFVNTVHAYNRVLNDVFEDEQVSKITVMESSIDVIDDSAYATFFTFCAGPLNAGGGVEIVRSDKGVDASVQVAMTPARLTCQTALLSDFVPGHELTSSTVLKISQPKQPLFYGRMLAGAMNRLTGAFSANHSYYDTSDVSEYFDNNVSRRTYPYFSDFLNEVKIYPIMSPGVYDVQINIAHSAGRYESDAVSITSPGGQPVSLSIDALAASAGLVGCTAFEVVVRAQNGAKIPTRVMHQLSYGDVARRSRLNSSVAVGLINEALFRPVGKTGMSWGQMILHDAYRSRTGFCFDIAEGDPADVTVQLYSGRGVFHEWTQSLSPGQALIFGDDDIPRPADASGCIWYLAKSSRPDLSAQSFHVHKASGNASGEHSF